ncbi:putative RNA-directed DNA polymerase [Helianthus debilis subsp. tardiflorus]
MIRNFKDRMMKVFEMTDLGLLSYYLGIEVEQKKEGITLKQSGYAKKILKSAGMFDCNPSKWPMEPKLKFTKDESGEDVNPTEYHRLIGSLRYLIHTRPDLGYSTGVLSRFMERPKQSHFSALKQVLRYVKGSVDYGLQYRKGGKGELLGYSDSSQGLNVEDGRATTGIAQQVKLLVDNESAIALMRNPVFHGRSKHIDTKYHFIRECIERGQIQVQHVSGELQKAEILTKALPRIKFG